MGHPIGKAIEHHEIGTDAVSLTGPQSSGQIDSEASIPGLLAVSPDDAADVREVADTKAKPDATENREPKHATSRE